MSAAAAQASAIDDAALARVRAIPGVAAASGTVASQATPLTPGGRPGYVLSIPVGTLLVLLPAAALAGLLAAQIPRGAPRS